MVYQIKSDQVASRAFEGEAVLIHYGSSEYFSLNQSGTLIWEALAEAPRSEEEVANALSATFRFENAKALQQVQDLFRQLEDADLVEQANETPDGREALVLDDAGLEEPYQEPVLTKCGDLETLILSGE